jgi:hypothetical protein
LVTTSLRKSRKGQDLAQRQGLGDAVDQDGEVERQGVPQLGVLHQLVHQLLDGATPLALDLDVDAVGVGQVFGQLRGVNLGDLARFGPLDRLFHDRLGRDLVRELADFQHLLAGQLLDTPLDLDGAPAGLIDRAKVLRVDDDPSAGQVGAGHDLEELVDGDVGVVQDQQGGADHLGRVVRGYGAGHRPPHSHRAVHEQVRERHR